jgi:hypothetical protein
VWLGRGRLAYVLLNARKHWVQSRSEAPPMRIDEASSGRWFQGWKRDPPLFARAVLALAGEAPDQKRREQARADETE